MTIKQYPFYLKSTVVLIGLVTLCFILLELSDILIPLSFGLLLAILLNPLSNILERRRIPRVWAIVLSLVAAIIVFALIGYFIVSQASLFTDDLPVLKKKMTELSGQLMQSISSQFGITVAKQNQMIVEFEGKLKPLVGSMLGTALGSLAVTLIIPVYTFLFMYYKSLLLNFLYESFESQSKEVEDVLSETKGAIQNYMIGLLLEALAVGALNVAALLILGVKYAVLLGVLGAILNVLPYIGGIIAISLPIIVATITKDGFQTQLFVIIAYLVIQFIDNHFLVPNIVASKVKINALISIVIVLLGGALWGVAGMFLSIPFIGVMKIIFDRIPELKPWGKLLGDEVPTRIKKDTGKVKLKKAEAA